MDNLHKNMPGITKIEKLSEGPSGLGDLVEREKAYVWEGGNRRDFFLKV